MRVTAKILGLFFVCVVLLTAITSYSTVWRSYQRYKSQQEAAARIVTQLVERELSESYSSGGVSGVKQRLGELSRDISGLEFHWTPLDLDRAPLGDLEIGRSVHVEQVRLADSRERALLITRDVLLDNERIGTLALQTSMQNWEAENSESLVLTLLSLGTLAMLAIGTVYVAGVRWIAKPLERLTQQAKRIGEGDFSARVDLDRNDELGQLAATLNQTSQLLARQRDQISIEVQQRLEATEQLRHADRLKTVGRLAAGVAHELGTPLAVISGRAGTLARSETSCEEVKRSATAIKDEADRMADIIRQLLDYSRRRDPQRRPVDLWEIVHQVTLLLEPIADKAHQSLELENESQPALAHVDPGQIQQVLTNLVLNAIQAAQTPGVIRIRIAEALPHDDSLSANTTAGWSISVTDQSGGIQQTDVDSIFEPFVTSKASGEGTGLGLPIARGLMEDHGGTLTCDNQPGEGATFTIWLPKEPQA